MKNLILSLILLLSTLTYLSAQDATIFGVILGDDVPEGLIDATVKVAGYGTVTDFDGSYSLSVPAGEHTLEISYVGYKTLTQDIVVASGEEKEINATLETESNILQTATVTSGKFEKPLGEVTVSLEVVKPTLIENNNSLSIDNVLEKVPSVQIIDGQANIRGGSGWSYGAGSRVLLLVDDMPAMQGDAGLPNWRDIPVENLAQIEVVKGAASALYGSSAMNGIINVRTAYAKSEPVTKVAAFYTFYDSPKDEQKKWWGGDSNITPSIFGVQAAHRQKFGKLDLVLGQSFYKEDSYLASTFDNKGRATMKLRYRPNVDVNYGVNVNYNTGKSGSFFYWRDGGEGAMTYASNTRSRSEVERFFVDPFFNAYDSKRNKHKILARFLSVSNANSNPDNPATDQSNFSKTLYGEYQFQRDNWASKFLEDYVLTTGIVGQTTGVEGSLYGTETFRSSNVAAYAQLDKKFFDKLNVSLGFRYEYNLITAPDTIDLFLPTGDSVPLGFPDGGRAEEAKPVFRFGMSYQPADFTYVRASFGQGYRFPTIAEKFIQTDVGGILVAPNKDLRSETGWSAELGIKQGFKIMNFSGFVDIAGFWTEYQDMMEFNSTLLTFDQAPFVALAIQSQNVGDTKIQGIDFTLSGTGDIGNATITTLSGYTFLNPKYAEFDTSTPAPGEDITEGQINAANSSSDANILKYRSQHTFKFDTQVDYNKFAGGIGMFYASNVEAIDNLLQDIIPGTENYRNNDTNGYFQLDTRLSYKVTDYMKMSFIIKNILNEEYLVRPGILNAPRNFAFRLDFDF